jgi:hypothetical protein
MQSLRVPTQFYWAQCGIDRTLQNNLLFVYEKIAGKRSGCRSLTAPTSLYPRSAVRDDRTMPGDGDCLPAEGRLPRLIRQPADGRVSLVPPINDRLISSLAGRRLLRSFLPRNDDFIDYQGERWDIGASGADIPPFSLHMPNAVIARTTKEDEAISCLNCRMLQGNARLPNEFMASNLHSGSKIPKSCHSHIMKIENFLGLPMTD